MAIALRIDGITNANGKANIGYTYGNAPLPVEASGLSIELTVAGLNAELADVQPMRILLLMVFALWKANNPALNNPALVIGRTITFNPGASLSPVSVV